MDLITAVKATYEVIGQDLSDLGIQAIILELKQYPEPAVLDALTRCRKELRKITLADILDRLPHGHPGPEEAWAIVSRTLNNEYVSIVWTEQMAQAAGVARPLTTDPVAARLAFKESYTALVSKARAKNQQPTWIASLGYDPVGRQAALEEAVQCGRLSVEHATRLMPSLTLTQTPTTLPVIGKDMPK
ncbi:MAG: hypothetical protein CV089_23905 [Nitrospira sp. WS110]|nr:hypothetical protein [Nitrospira sp. WS110]